MQLFKNGVADTDVVVVKTSKVGDGRTVISVSSISGTELSIGDTYTTDVKHLKNVSLKLTNKVADNLYLLEAIK